MSNLIIPASKVSKKFIPYFEQFHRYEILFGGRGSAKSTHAAIKLLARAAVDEYFHCIYARKWSEHIRDGQFALFKRIASYMGWENEFKFSESTFQITCIRNGNKFIAKGLDNVEKTKSISEPTHVWVEEADQIEFEDFDTLNKGLRTNATQCSFLMSFNTFIPPTHWIRKTLFDQEQPYELAEQFASKSFLMHSTYLDNDFIDHEEYAETLTIDNGGNRFKVESDLKGLWGEEPNDNPWLHAFEEQKHVKPLKFIPSYPVHLSFDFNNNPFTCVAFQMSPHKGAYDSFIHVIKEFSGVYKVEDMCSRIAATFPNSILYITGDRSGQNEDIGRNQTLYQMIAGLLQVSDKLLDLNNSNLEHADSCMLMNRMFYNYPNIFIDPDGCPLLILDCLKAQSDPKSKKPLQLNKDRTKGFQMDLFDAMRYFFQTYFHSWAKDNYFRAMKK